LQAVFVTLPFVGSHALAFWLGGLEDGPAFL